MVYFKLQLDEQDMSNLAHQIPEESFLLIKPVKSSDEYYGVIEDGWYSEMIKNLPRQIVDSLEVVSSADIKRLLEQSDKTADQRRYAGNVNLFRLL